MGKGMNVERWKKQCIKAIEAEDSDALRRTLDQSENVEFGWGRVEEEEEVLFQVRAAPITH